MINRKWLWRLGLVLALILAGILFSAVCALTVRAAVTGDPYINIVQPGWVEVACFGCGFTNPPGTTGYIIYHRFGEIDTHLMLLSYGGLRCPGNKPPCYDFWYNQWNPAPDYYVLLSGEITGAPSYKVITGFPVDVHIPGLYLPVVIKD